ncbi:MAG: AI-2E family transporter, partial [Pseudomonadota bacterium]
MAPAPPPGGRGGPGPSPDAGLPGTGAIMRWSAGTLMVLALLAALYAGREILVPMALAILLWFLVDALARALRGFAWIAERLPMPLAKALVVLLFIGLTVFAGRLIAVGIGEISAGLDPEESALLARIVQTARALGLPVASARDLLLGLYPYEALLAAALDFSRGLVNDIGLVFLYVMFLLIDQRHFGPKLKALFPESARREEVAATLEQIGREAEVYLRLMFLISAGVGTATFVVAAAFGLQGAAFWGFIAFVLNFVPTLGSILAVVLPASYALLTFSDPFALAALMLMLGAVQFTAGEVVLPRVMGDNLNLSSFVVLVALVFWGAVWGPVGMFLGIPVTVIGLVLCARYRSTRP